MASNSNKYRCDKCGERSALLDLDNMAICSKCYLICKPPVLCLDQYDTNPHFWNRTQNRHEFVTNLKDFLECGWFLRKVEEFVSKVPKFSTKRVHLEYYGKSRCIRFAEYYKKLSLEHLGACKKPGAFCKKRAEE